MQEQLLTLMVTYQLIFQTQFFVGSKLQFTIIPSVNDLIPIRNQIFEIANTNVIVTMQDDAGTGTTVTSTSATGTVSSTTTSTGSGPQRTKMTAKVSKSCESSF